MNKIKRYRKKSIIIEALLYNGKNSDEITSFTEGRAFLFGKNNEMEIPTLEDNNRCRVGDYVIKGIQGEFYPCNPDIFKIIYEEVNNDT